MLPEVTAADVHRQLNVFLESTDAEHAPAALSQLGKVLHNAEQNVEQYGRLPPAAAEKLAARLPGGASQVDAMFALLSLVGWAAQEDGAWRCVDASRNAAARGIVQARLAEVQRASAPRRAEPSASALQARALHARAAEERLSMGQEAYAARATRYGLASQAGFSQIAPAPPPVLRKFGAQIVTLDDLLARETQADGADGCAIGRRAHELTNEYRATKQLAPLSWAAPALAPAQAHAEAMAHGRAPFSHDGFDARVARIPGRGFGENLAASRGAGDPAAVAVDGWIKSDGHRANLEGAFDAEAIGVATGPLGCFLVQIFVVR